MACMAVDFRYDPSEPQSAGLRDLSFTVRPGSSVAFCGPSGSGKSTTAKLLCRLFDTQGGSVLVGGVNVRKVTQRSLRSAIAVVAQDTVLFNTTIAENLKFGAPGATMEELRSAARSAQLLEKIESWPDGFQTKVGERGLRLSGGEKQRLGTCANLHAHTRCLPCMYHCHRFRRQRVRSPTNELTSNITSCALARGRRGRNRPRSAAQPEDCHPRRSNLRARHAD